MKTVFTSIPTKLCEYAIVNRKVNHLCLYLYLKHNSSGYIEYGTQEYKSWANDLNKSDKWIRTAINWLIKEKWITVNSKKKTYRIISYANLSKKLNTSFKSAVIYETENFLGFKNFCCAVVITYHLKLKRWKDKERRSVSKMGDASSNRYCYPKGFYDLPIRYLAKVLNLSDTTANNIKKNALKDNYIILKKQINIMTDVNGTKIKKENFIHLKKMYPVQSGRLRIGKKYLKIVDADLMKPEIITKRKLYKF